MYMGNTLASHGHRVNVAASAARSPIVKSNRTRGESIMPNSLPRRALISISSFNGAIYPGGRKTGGKSIIHGRTVTGFTIEGEMMLGILDKMREDAVQVFDTLQSE